MGGKKITEDVKESPFVNAWVAQTYLYEKFRPALQKNLGKKDFKKEGCRDVKFLL